MKQQYEKITEDSDWCWHTRNVGRYSLKHRYYRSVATQNEHRQNCGAEADGHRVRGKRKYIPHSWDDRRVSRDWKRSWKDFTKNKHQYGAGR